MKISIQWIEEILGSKLETPTEELSKILLNLGFEVAAIQSYPKCTGVVLGKILKISPHPNADRLRIVEVTDGRETINLVCGAPNLTVGQSCLWAKTGALLADGKELKGAVIRGVNSEGMLLSAKELGVGNESTGLWTFTEKTPLGTSLEDLVSLEDSVLDLEITPNRPDCLSHYGIARELAAALNRKGPQSKDFYETHSGMSSPTVMIEDPKCCSQYIARLFENVTVGSSPLKLQTRFMRCGILPINNLVDMSNSILLEFGQPLHVFDADRLEDKKIIVRKAISGEKILALDGKVYDLDPEILVIADGKKPVAIAGVMGGQDSAVTYQTKNVLLESAVFNRTNIRRSRTKLGLASESSYRFERGVTQWSCEMGSWKGAQDLEILSQGYRCSVQNLQPILKENKGHSLDVSRVSKVLGLELTPEEMCAQLHKLAIPTLFKDGLKVEVESPAWRLDLESDVDFIEEVARMIGYTHIPKKGTDVTLTSKTFSTNEILFSRKVRRELVSLGFYECINYGLVSSKECRSTDGSNIELENPLSQEQSILRPTLLLELLKNLKTNVAYQNKEARLFEIGTVYHKKGDPLEERTYLGGLATGSQQAPYWKLKHREPIEFFWIKSVLETLFSALHLPKIEWQALSPDQAQSTPFLTHPHYSFELRSADQKQKLGWCGLLHPKVIKEEKFENDVALFELDLEVLKLLAQPQTKVHPVVRTPKIKRDCSLWIGEEILWRQIESEIKKVGGKLLEECSLFDLYRDKLKKHLKSLSFTLSFVDPQNSLQDETANQLRDKILAHLHDKFKAELRTK